MKSIIEAIKNFYVTGTNFSFLRIKLTIYIGLIIISTLIARAIYFNNTFKLWPFFLICSLAIIFITVVLGEKITGIIINYIKKKYYNIK